MRNPERIDVILKLIEKIWKDYPDLRLCQLIGCVFVQEDIFYREDDELLKGLISTFGEQYRTIDVGKTLESIFLENGG